MAGLQARRVTMKDTISRWGSCAPDGSLAFSWRLVMAPRLRPGLRRGARGRASAHMNHGRRFWALVRTLTTQMDPAVSWLHAEGQRLMRIG